MISLADLAKVLKKNGLEQFGVLGAEDGFGRDAGSHAWALRRAQWLAMGNNADMVWLERNAALAFDPAAVMSGARRMVICLLPWPGSDAAPLVPQSNGMSPTGLVAAYARGRDYHKTLRAALQKVSLSLGSIFPGANFRILVDADPLCERYYAHAAGLGFIGRNTMLINPRYGSCCTIGLLLCDADLPLGNCHDTTVEPDGLTGPGQSCPPACRRCIEACPSKALDSVQGLDARRCLSWQTVEYTGPVEPAAQSAQGERLFACDACTSVCPFNQGHHAGSWAMDLAAVLSWQSHKDHVAACAGTALMRADWRSLVRNALIVAGNRGDASLVPAVESWAISADSMLSDHAKEAYRKIIEKLGER